MKQTNKARYESAVWPYSSIYSLQYFILCEFRGSKNVTGRNRTQPLIILTTLGLGHYTTMTGAESSYVFEMRSPSIKYSISENTTFGKSLRSSILHEMEICDFLFLTDEYARSRWISPISRISFSISAYITSRYTLLSPFL